MDDVFILNENGTDASRAGLLRLHDAVVRREAGRPEAALSPEELLALFRAFDPTRNAACLPWLLRTYAAGGYRLEDLSKAHDTLSAFARLREQLPNTATIDGEVRNPRKLGSHVTLASLWKAVAPLVEAERLSQEDCSGEQDDTDRERALAQSRVLYRSNRMVVAVPMTVEASCWWGQGTQWCTAARKNNAFEKYHKDAPLIVICLRKVGNLPARKLQLYVHAIGLQFMDENDARVSPEIILERWQDLEALLHWAVGRQGQSLVYIPEPLRTEAICTTAVTEDGCALRLVPERLSTEAICTVAVGSNGLALEYVPEHLCTEAVCLAAVEQDGEALQYVPEPLRTEAVCLVAVGRHGEALYYVSESLRTEAICLAAVTQNGTMLEYVPKPLRTLSVYLAAVGRNGRELQLVPEPLRTEAICTAAVEQHGLALADVPKLLRTEKMCLAAVGSSNGMALKYVPERLLTEAVYLTAVIQNGWKLKEVPESLRTETICLAAVTQNGQVLVYVPEHLRTEAICSTAVGGSGLALHYVPKPLRTEALCMAAVTQDVGALIYVPMPLRTEVTRLITAKYNEHKTVSVTGETNMSKTHDLVLESLKDYIKNLLPGHQNTVSFIK